MIDELRDLYQEVILDHGRNPRNFGPPAQHSCQARGNNPMCGDRVTVYLTLDDDNMITDARFDGRGCAISTASASMMTEVVRGKSLAEVQRLFDSFHRMCTGDDDAALRDESHQDDLDRLEVLSGVREFPVRVKCATLPWHTLKAALDHDTDNDVTTE